MTRSRIATANQNTCFEILHVEGIVYYKTCWELTVRLGSITTLPPSCQRRLNGGGSGTLYESRSSSEAQSLSRLASDSIIISPAIEKGEFDILEREPHGDLRTMLNCVVESLDQDDDAPNVIVGKMDRPA